jgi:hypothetical protein
VAKHDRGRRRRSHAGGVGEAARTAVSQGWRGIAMFFPPCILIAVR